MEIHQEQIGRERWKNNIIQFNESESSDIGKDEKMATDVTTATGILAALDVPTNDFCRIRWT